MALLTEIGFPAILEVQVTVAVVNTYGALLDTYTGCAPTSVGRMEKIIVPEMLAVTVSVTVDTMFPAAGEAALSGTLTHT